jgi:hypothetical protein
MSGWLTRARGAIGIGLTWAVGWAPIGAVTGWITATFLGFPLGVVATNYAVMFAALGLICGTFFSALLTLAEGRRSFEELSMPRSVAWGALGGVVLGGLSVFAGLLGAGPTVIGAAIVTSCALLGAVSAAATLALARAAQGRVGVGTVGSGPDPRLLTADRSVGWAAPSPGRERVEHER